MAISQESKVEKWVFLKTGRKGHRDTMRRLPWNYVKYDDSDVDWSIEPVNWGGEFETDTGGTPFPLIQQVGVNKGSVVGFEVIEPSQASEFWKVFRISDGPDDASDPDSF